MDRFENKCLKLNYPDITTTKKELYDLQVDIQGIKFSDKDFKRWLAKSKVEPLKIDEKHKDAPIKQVQAYLYRLFEKYKGKGREINREDLEKLEDIYFKYFLFESLKFDKIREAVKRYYLYRNIWGSIFVENLGDLVGKEEAKRLVLIGFVESYFGLQNNNPIAKGPFQFTEHTARLYGLMGKGKDLRNHPIYSAEAAARLIRHNILDVLVKTGKINLIIKEKRKYVAIVKKYKVKLGDNFDKIARRYNLPSNFLMAYNGYKSSRLSKNAELEIPIKFKPEIWKLIGEDGVALALEEYNGGLINRFNKFPKTIVEYDTRLKDLYNNPSNSTNDKNNIFQQFNYPWKYKGAKEFFKWVEQNVGDLEYKKVPKEFIFQNLYKILPRRTPLRLDDNIGVVYNGESLDDLVEQVYSRIDIIEKYKLVKDKVYIVKKGDTLFKIWQLYAKDRKITFMEFLHFNKKNLKSTIRVGEKIYIPKRVKVREKRVSKSALRKMIKDRILEILEKKGILEKDTFKIKVGGDDKEETIYFIRIVNINGRKSIAKFDKN